MSVKTIDVALIHVIYTFITARKRSLGQGNMSTPVCHSVHRGAVWSKRGAWSRGGWSWGCLVWGVPGPGGAWWRPPGRLLLRAVRILLECILVSRMV